MTLQIRDKIRFPLSGDGSEPSTGKFYDSTNSYHFAICGIPFLSAISKENPAVIKSADFKRQQIDQSPEPGEQSLTGWWTRSQLSFHGGMGLKYSDPALDPSAPFRYDDSEGVDVWTPGQVSLLRKAVPVTIPAGTQEPLLVGGQVWGKDMVVWAKARSVGWVGPDNVNTPITPNPVPGSDWTSMTSDGQSWYLACKDGVWKLSWPSLGAPTLTKLWNGSDQWFTLGWCKGRLMAGVNEKIYELVPPASGNPPYNLPDKAVYTSPVPGWGWTSITAGPEAIYVSGGAGNRGSILSIALDTSGALPTLTGATEVAQLPTGETPRVIRVYLGNLMAIGTTKGVRIADITNSYRLAVTYGPLIETPRPVLDVTGVDRFVYATWSNAGLKCGLMRIDLGMKHQTGRYAYAKDLLVVGPGTVRAVASLGETDRLAFTVTETGLYIQSANELVDNGFLKASATRFNTLWSKMFRRMTLRAQVKGQISVSAVDRLGNILHIATATDDTDLSQDLSISKPDSPQEQLGIQFVLSRKSATEGPLLQGYALKAMPGGPRQFSILLPVLCFDYEKDADNDVMGGEGYGYERLRRMMDCQSKGAVVLFEDLKAGNTTLVTIEDIEFRQEGPGGAAVSPWGGVLTLSMRTIE